MLRLPLDALHRELGARMGAFAGHQMPIQYPAGLKSEHLHTRSQASLFDVSHMGQIRVSGDRLRSVLEAALPVDFDGWPRGLQRYSFLLNEHGGIEDDLMLVNGDDDVRMVVNAGNRDADMQWLQRHCPGLSFEWLDAALLALQGPAAETVLSLLDPAAARLGFMQSAVLTLEGTDCFVTRSGYTGEDGFEISVPLTHAEGLARRLLAAPAVRPAGLGARDTLRLEAGLPLHGSDIGPTTTPVEARLAFAIPRSRRSGGTKAGGFIGSAVVLDQLEQGVTRRLAGLVSTEAVPIRAHAALVSTDGEPAGEVTSGTVSPTLGKPVMLGYDTPDAAAAGTVLQAVVRGRHLVVSVVELPFVPKRYKR